MKSENTPKEWLEKQPEFKEKNSKSKFYIVCESYTDYTQFEGAWSVFVKEFDSLEEANSWIKESKDWQESKQYERTTLGPLVEV